MLIRLAALFAEGGRGSKGRAGGGGGLAGSLIIFLPYYGFIVESLLSLVCAA